MGNAMTIRKRRSPAPSFRQPPPFNPITGRHAPIGWNADLTRVALMQVTEEHDDYLLCRGYDHENRVGLNEVCVAKPLVLQKTPWDGKTYTIDGVETTFTYDDPEVVGGVSTSRTVEEDGDSSSQTILYPYFVGDILACVKPQTKLGETQGTPDEESYTAAMDILDVTSKVMYEDEDEVGEGETRKVIAWMDLNVAGRGWASSSIRRFELKDALTPGGSATAYLLYWLDETSSYSTLDEDLDYLEFEVYDARGDLNGKAKTTDGQGSRGYAKQMSDSQRWEIVAIQQYKRCTCKAKGAFTSASGTFTVDNVAVIDGISPLSDPTDTAEELTVTNSIVAAGADNVDCRIEYNQTTAVWEIYAIALVSQVVQTTYQVDGANKEFEKKTRTLLGYFDDAESGWTVVHTGDDCP